jgi:hypothetical protein
LKFCDISFCGLHLFDSGLSFSELLRFPLFSFLAGFSTELHDNCEQASDDQKQQEIS